MMSPRSTLARLGACLAVISLAVAACGSDDDDVGSDAITPDDTAGGADSSDDTTAGDGGTATGAADLAGESVEIFGAFANDEADRMRETLQPFIDQTGIEVDYVDSPAFDTEITTRVEGGNLPDIAVFPQPGLLLDIASETGAVPVGEYLDVQALEESLIPGFLAATTAEDGSVFGFPIRMAVKSALWYPSPEFVDSGYAIPANDVELTALEDQIIADGNTPWCLGMESGAGTGWVGTDWIEEYMLRLHGPDVYDQWVSHEIPFDSPEVRAAFEKFEELWNKEGNVVGDTQGILSLNFGDSPADLFTDSPGCHMHRQGNFITGFFPEDVQGALDENVAVAYFPPVDGGYDGNPVLAGGDLAMLLNDTPAARATMEFLSTATYGEEWAAAGGWLSPHKDFDASIYPTEVERDLFAIGADADVLRFDASDLMPGPVGTGSFWTGMVDWIGGQRSLDEVLSSIDESWPQS